ncbi:hypothetical protein O1611_g69 [Lasiodiplodia mahajangana]|uniref:Uncharacterized protein n=1 Tax=Lasiodiplodia mahajangana TaxID=1108764 RepID=A0ACC2K212_9PEZI|nr:hypothetical protein O1611_g69 [Lasiodiplodia mahajangana]
MTDKCWFVLRHAYHPPPAVSNNHGISMSKGLLSIGHVITSIRVLDVINPETGPLPYPPSMPIAIGRAYNFEWRLTEQGNTEVSTHVDAPIAAVACADLGLNAGIAFKTAVHRFWEFERLETFSVNITQSYVDDTMETAEVESYMDKHKHWLIKNPSLYIITGIMVGRKAKLSVDDKTGRGVNAGALVGVSGIAGIGGGFDVSSEKGSLSSQEVDDFVFAIRVAKVTKGFLDRSWSWATLSEGATFGAGDSSKQKIESIKSQLEAIGYRDNRIIGMEDHADEVFVL